MKRPGTEARLSPDLYSPPGVLDNPPVVDVLEGVAGHLLLVGAATAVLISARRGCNCGWGVRGPRPPPKVPTDAIQPGVRYVSIPEGLVPPAMVYNETQRHQVLRALFLFFFLRFILFIYYLFGCAGS